jgi:hypothetical protein
LPNQPGSVWVIAEKSREKIAEVTLELLGKAREIAARRGSPLTTAILPGKDADLSAAELKGYLKPVTVFATADAGLLAVVKSILDGAGIKYFARNELIQGILPVQSGAFNTLVEIQVRPEDADDARALLDV